MTALINGALMTMLILNGSNRFQCILSSNIINIVSVRLQEHIKICGLRGGNGLYRRYACRDCKVSTEDADNLDIGCKCRKVSDDKKFLN